MSHDRDFLDGLVDKMYEFRDGKVKEHLGGVSDFLEKRKIENLRELERRFGPTSASSQASPANAKAVPVTDKDRAREDFEKRRSESKEIAKLKRRVEFLENEIGKIEGKMKEIEKVLSNPSKEDDIMELTRTYLEHKRDLDHKTAEWESLMEKLDE